MTESYLFIPGWSAKLDQASLKAYPIEFQYSYPFELLRMYIQNGDYKTSKPFGLSNGNDSLYLISSEPIDEVNIHNNPATCSTESSSITTTDWHDTFIITTIHSILEEEGYLLPIRNRSLMGKAKQTISFAKQPIRTLDVRHKGNDLTISCYESEWFEVLSDNNDVCILHHPKHEFREDRFGLMDPELVDFLVRDRWSDAKRNPSSIHKRYSKLDSLLQRECSQGKVNLERLGAFSFRQLRKPSVIFPNGTKVDFNSDSLNYSDLVSRNIDFEEGPETITFVIDETKQENLSKSENVRQFKEAFQKITGREVLDVPVNDIETIQDINSDAAIIIINDESPGAGLVYDRIKNHVVIPSKVIRTTTINGNKGQFNDLTQLAWMGLRFRTTQKLHHTLSSEFGYSPTALSLTSHMGGEFLALLGASIINGKLESRVTLLEQDYTKEIPDYNTTEKLLGFLSAKSTHTPLILFSDTITLPPILKSYCDRHEALAINVRPVSGTILKSESDIFSIPPSGSFVQLLHDTYLIQTDGYPDFEGDGIPRSVLVRPVSGTIKDINSVLEYIYALTFIHPTSLAKPKLPLPLHMVRSLPSSIRKRLEESWILEGFLQ